MAKKKTKAPELRPYDSAEYLDSDKAVSAYMEEALETDDSAFVTHALDTIARARSMSKNLGKEGQGLFSQSAGYGFRFTRNDHQECP